MFELFLGILVFFFFAIPLSVFSYEIKCFYVILFKTIININIVSNFSYYTVSIRRKKRHLI